MLKSKTNQNGFALVVALFMSAIVLVTTSVMIFVINANTKDIVRTKISEQALNLAEEGLEHELHYISLKNKQLVTTADGDITPDITTFNFPSLVNNSYIIYSTYPSLPAFPILPGLTLVTPNPASLVPSEPFNLKNLGSDNLSLYKPSKGIIEGGKVIGEMQVKSFVSEIGTQANGHPGYDTMMVVSIGYIPDKANARISRKVSTKIRRPKTIVGTFFPHNGISAYGSFNAGTNSHLDVKACPSCAELAPGDTGFLPIDLYSQTSIVGVTDPFYGTASAVGAVASTIDASGGRVSNAPKEPDAFPKYTESTTPCVPTSIVIGGITRTAYGATGSCTITGSLSSNAKIVIYNTVSYTGDINGTDVISGTSDTIVKGDPSSLSKFVVTGDVTVSGNSPPSNSHLLYVVQGKTDGTKGNLDLKGNGTNSGFFYLTNPLSTVTMAGGGNSGQFFGAIISKGNVNINSHYEFTFDATLATLPITILTKPLDYNANPEPLKID